ncbi:MAG TPA: hypothetical protein VK428_11640 [Acidimicrobiales bacterium]|nr:hypothetical protein [Acidimicrobiales bacterium]
MSSPGLLAGDGHLGPPWTGPSPALSVCNKDPTPGLPEAVCPSWTSCERRPPAVRWGPVSWALFRADEVMAQLC